MAEVALAETVGLCVALVYELGPLHAYVAILLGPPVRERVEPVQTGPLLLAVEFGGVLIVAVTAVLGEEIQLTLVAST
jgi:hypothetical protein